MNFIKRAMISVFRQLIKSGIFLLLVFLLSMLTSGAILVRSAINNTDQNLRKQMPTVATVIYNFDYDEMQLIYEQTGEWPHIEEDLLTLEILRTIGSFPQVKLFDYSIDMNFGVTGSGLTAWERLGWGSSFWYDPYLGVSLSVGGVGSIDFLEIRDRFMELVSGRSFNELDLNETGDIFPVLIASGFAEANGFNIDSYFDVQVVVFDQIEFGDGYMEDRDSPPVFETTFPLKVIGIFDPILPYYLDSEDELEWERYAREVAFQHRIYVPNAAAEMMFNVRAKGQIGPTDIFFQNLYLLNDPLDFSDFAYEVENMTGNWRAVDYSRGFEEISASMANMHEVANLVLFMAIGATILLISLLVLLFLHDRKHEIGVYLALGEKKGKIVLQILIELIPLAIIGITLALFAGNLMASGLSHEILRQELANPSHRNTIEESHALEELGYRFELSHAEMLEAYEISIDFETVVLFYAIGLGTVLIAAIIPISHFINLSPKKNLL